VALDARRSRARATVPLWFADAELAGFIWPNDNNADMIMHPAHRDAEPAMVA